jgi:hypothetical protein
MHQISRTAPFAVAVAALAACGSPPRLGTDARGGCVTLQGTIPASAVGLPGGAVTIESATLSAPTPLAVAAQGPTPAAMLTPAMPEHCKVLGSISPLDPSAPPIKFQVNLPTNWNGRSVQYGGGGFNGVLITGQALVPAAPYDKPAPLAQGFVTVGTDSGHQNQPGVSPMAFAANPEALVNFAHASYKKVRDVSVELMKRAYGKAPDKMYFVGSSEGGREGLTMAQRYPAAFDGIFARVPVINWTLLQFAGTRNGAATFGEGWLRPGQVKLVHDAVLAACDAADGLADRVVSDAAGCRSRFDIGKLQCAGAAGGDSCLSEAQVKAVRTLHSPYRVPFALANGVVEYPGFPLGGEDTMAFGPTGGWRAWWLGGVAPTQPPGPGQAIAWTYGSGALSHFYLQQPAADPRNLDPRTIQGRMQEVSLLMDSTNPDLSAFQARGGKLILLENMADYAQSPYAGITYHATVVQRMGRDRVDGFFKVYAAPGVDHVGTGAPGLVDMLTPLVAWVERGQAPVGLQLAEMNSKPPFSVVRTRPLCEWPAWPKYSGGGDVNAASSFACTK